MILIFYIFVRCCFSFCGVYEIVNRVLRRKFLISSKLSTKSTVNKANPSCLEMKRLLMKKTHNVDKNWFIIADFSNIQGVHN